MGRTAKDVMGMRYGSLTVIERSENVGGAAMWVCRCDCGNVVVVAGYSLRRGAKSCGCRRGKRTGEERGARFSDKTGKRYGKLVVVSFFDVEYGGYSRWLCKCDCGNEVVVSTKSLWNNAKTSCGCSHKLPNGQAAFNSVYYSYMANAKKRGYSWQITKEQFREIVAKDCFYCGGHPSNAAGNKHGTFMYNGIDRMDKGIGYIHGNIVPCCKRCNRAKMNDSVAEFVDMIKSVYRHFVLDSDSHD